MNVVTEHEVRERLRTVLDPELQKDLVTLGMVKDVAVDGSNVLVHIELTTPACPLRGEITRDVEQAVKQIDGVEHVEVKCTARVRSARPDSVRLPGVKNVIAVGAGKGTAAVVLAYGLHRSGASVGLMDADVYGPSIPMMTGIEGVQPLMRDNMIVPAEARGVRIMSIGLMIDRDSPVIWRGPMAHGLVQQFLEQVDWGELDYLIVDLPPGTGDVPLSLAQSISVTGLVVVCTPQDIAILDARRAVGMYQRLGIPCLGIVENMSYYLCPNCGHRDELFDHGGAQAAARELNVPFLGEIPLNTKVRIFGDAGQPERILADTDDYVSRAINRVVANTAAQVSIMTGRAAATRLS
jgi:ATP-binding protein involved in chromosome partitioning